MSWRDRDYARLTDEERRTLFGSGTRTGAPASGRARVAAPRRSVPPALFVAVAVSAVAVVAGGRVVRLPLSSAHEPRPPARAPVVAIRWRPSDLVPATSSGRECIDARSYGRICASYTIGERPADTLTRRLGSLGLRVESSG